MLPKTEPPNQDKYLGEHVHDWEANSELSGDHFTYEYAH